VAGATTIPALIPPAEVERILAQGLADGGDPSREHPAVVAFGLRGRAPLHQAAALRALPRGTAGAVSRALRAWERGAP
jgi:hypothetical protein